MKLGIFKLPLIPFLTQETYAEHIQTILFLPGGFFGPVFVRDWLITFHTMLLNHMRTGFLACVRSALSLTPAVLLSTFHIRAICRGGTLVEHKGFE
jgi:hypothetical protein